MSCERTWSSGILGPLSFWMHSVLEKQTRCEPKNPSILATITKYQHETSRGMFPCNKREQQKCIQCSLNVVHQTACITSIREIGIDAVDTFGPLCQFIKPKFKYMKLFSDSEPLSSPSLVFCLSE